MTQRHNVVKKWETKFPEGLAQHFFEVENKKFVWVFVTEKQTDQHIRSAYYYDGSVYTIEQLIKNEQKASPDSYQMVCEFVSAVEDKIVLPYWRADIKSLKCECGSDACGSPQHSDWCPKC